MDIRFVKYSSPYIEASIRFYTVITVAAVSGLFVTSRRSVISRVSFSNLSEDDLHFDHLRVNKDSALLQDTSL